MTPTSSQRIRANELKRASFDCQSCGAEVVLDLAKDEQRAHLSDLVMGGARCPVCNVMFDSGVLLALKSLVAFLAKVDASGKDVWFYVKPEQP